MAIKSELSGMELVKRFAQLARAGLPFNPADSVDITGANVDRLQKSMQSFGRKDPRFVTREQAKTNKWVINPKSESVDILVRNEANGLIEAVALFNAENVRGMPTLAAMLAMSNVEIAEMQGRGVAEQDMSDELSIGPARAVMLEAAVGQSAVLTTATQNGTKAVGPAELQPGYRRLVEHGSAPYQHVKGNQLSYFAMLEDAAGKKETLWGVDIDRSLHAAEAQLGDAISLTRNGHRQVEIDEKQADGSFIRKPADRINWDTVKQPPVLEKRLESQPKGLGATTTADGKSAAMNGKVADKRFAVMAPYWQDGLHNSEGITLANKINKTIKDNNLTRDRDAVARLLALHPTAGRLGIEIVSEERYLTDPHIKANLGEPRSLLDGALVRDKDGAYRPAAGGLPVLVDKGESVVLKKKGAEAYRGAMELAVAKGWTAIELTGKPAMLAEAWIEAKLMGLDVVNFSPSEKDKENYAARVAEESRRKSAEQGAPMEQTPEMVEVRPFIDANGKEITATVTYTVSYGGYEANYDNAKDAAKDFAGIPAAKLPAVVRSVTRANGFVHNDVVAGGDLAPEKDGVKRSLKSVLDQEFDAAMAEVIAEEKAAVSLTPANPTVVAGRHIGQILKIENGRVAQKIGRDPDKIVWHDMDNLKGAMLKIGEVMDIGYAKGLGSVKQTQGKELAGAGAGVGR